MKGLGILVIGIAVTVILAGLFLSGTFTSPYFQEEATFGQWGQDIKVIYEDGTNESLSMLINKPLSTLTYNSKAITGFDYGLAVKVTGTGYTGATVTLGSYLLKVNVRQPVDVQKPALGSTLRGTQTFTLTSGANTIPIDGVFHPIGGTANFAAKVSLDGLGLPADVYYIEFVPTGTVTYKGNPDGETQTTSLPSALSFTVSYSKGALSIEVTGGASSH